VGNRGVSLEQPIKNLKGFQRVTLAPGESKTITFSLGFDELAFFDNAGLELVEPSDYTVWVGGDSNAILSAHFSLER
jgi:beta-glucosidase